MLHWQRHFDPLTVEQLQGLRLPAPRRSLGQLAGHRRNPQLGGSADFAQHRQYVPGDDLRQVDWKVFGRTDRFFLKQREDETNLICHLAIDTSGSMGYSGPQASFDKLEAARRLAAAIAFVAMNQRDAISLTSFDHDSTPILPPVHAGTSSIRLVAEALDRLVARHETDLAKSINRLASRLPRRGLLMVISDFLDDENSVSEGIRRLAQRDHRLVLVQISDPAEEDLPWNEPLRLVGLEGEGARDIEPLSIRRAYRESRQKMFATLTETAKLVGAVWIQISSHQHLGTQVRRWLVRHGT